MRPAHLAAAALLGALLAAPPVQAQLYRWVDEQGRLHVTDDLSRVPPSIRDRVASDSADDRRAPAAPAPTPAARPAKPASEPPGEPAEEPRRHVIPVQRAGLEFAVEARLNGRYRAHFKVDTGATINTVPRHVVDELGIQIDTSTPVTVVAGISGEPMLVPVVTLDEVRLGDASVERVEAVVLDTLRYGLLGMPFFNHFRVHTDPAAGRLELEEIDLSAIDGVYGGYGEEYWRSRFRMVRAQLAQVAAYRARLPEEFGELHERLDSAERYWREQYESLELRASRDGVPRAWRE